MKNQELVFNVNAVQQTIGLRIMNLPQSCTNELVYTQLFQKLKIDTKKVKAFRVRGHKTQYNCLGDAFVYFDSEDSAQDAMNKIIGYELHSKVLNCSLLMPTSDLKLKNDKNVCVANLSNDVTLKSFYQAMSSHGQVLSVYINDKENKLGKRSGFASYKTVPFAETAQKEGVTINEKKYSCAVLKKQDKKEKLTTFNPELLSRNIKLTFDKPLILAGLTGLDLENQLRNQIQTKFGSVPTSVFVWGERARHMVEQNKKGEKASHVCTIVKKEGENQDTIEEQNGKKVYTCYQEGNTCSILQHARSTAFVCFDHPKQALEFVNNYYQACNGQKEINLYNFKFTVGTETLEVSTSSLRPYLKDDKQKIDEIKEFEQKNLPSASSDKSFIFFKNLKKDTTIQQLTEAIEKNTTSKVISIKLSAPNDETFIRDITKKSAETQFATVHLSDIKESETFITNFKQNSEFRNKFDLFEGYKYANYLAPKKIHKQELKAKNEKNKRQGQNNSKMNPNANIFPFLLMKQQMQGFNPMFAKGPIAPMMQPMMFPRFPGMPFNYNMNNQFQNRQFQNVPRGQSNPPPQGQFNNPRPQNNNNNNNNNMVNNKQNYNNNMGNRPQSQNRTYNKDQQQGGQQQQQQQQQYQQQRRNQQNFKGTTYPQTQARNQQDNKKGNAIQKPTNAPQNKTLVQPAQPPKPIVQPAQPPKVIAVAIPKIEELANKTDEEKKQVLGNCLAPKIQALLTEANKSFAPKVAGMLLDFEVYTPEEIIEMLNNQEELKENIDTALDLIQESTAQ